MKTIRIATRQSPLALVQTERVKAALLSQNESLNIVFVPIITSADKLCTVSLMDLGGKALFAKELEQALLNNEADIAVHSVKDLTPEMPKSLLLSATLKREDPRDVWVMRHDSTEHMPKGSTVGTCSPRRQALLKHHYPQFKPALMRGNVQTRLKKLDNGEVDSLILAAAGLIRLGLEDRIKQYIEPDTFVPAVGQGAIGIQCRETDETLIQHLKAINHMPTFQAILAERALIRTLSGDCHSAIGAYCQVNAGMLFLNGLVIDERGETVLKYAASGVAESPEDLGKMVGKTLLNQGAATLLQCIQ